MKTIVSHLKNGTYQRVYLFYGEEAYLKRFYEHRMKEKVLGDSMADMNLDVFEGKTVGADTIGDAADTLPFLSEYRLVIVKNSGLFATGRKDDTAKMVKIAEGLPETTVLVFVEDQVDKRNTLYKKVNSLASGYVAEFKPPSEKELLDWAAKIMKQKGVEMPRTVASYFLRTVSFDMNTIEREGEKLAAYKNNEGTAAIEDIDLVCTKSLEARIFDLVDALGNKKGDRAMEIYANLMVQKESPIMVLSMIARQLRLILQVSELKGQHMDTEAIGARLGIRGFVARECLKQSGNFSRQDLLGAVKACFDTDINIKTGRINDRLAVEVLLIKYAS